MFLYCFSFLLFSFPSLFFFIHSPLPHTRFSSFIVNTSQFLFISHTLLKHDRSIPLARPTYDRNLNAMNRYGAAPPPLSYHFDEPSPAGRYSLNIPSEVNRLIYMPFFLLYGYLLWYRPVTHSVYLNSPSLFYAYPISFTLSFTIFTNFAIILMTIYQKHYLQGLCTSDHIPDPILRSPQMGLHPCVKACVKGVNTDVGMTIGNSHIYISNYI